VTLAKTVLAATATFHQTVLSIPKWALCEVNKNAHGFVWKGDNSKMASGGHCLINWKTIYRSKDNGGLSLLDLERVGRALHLRWPWLEWTDPDKPWFGSKLPRDEDDMLPRDEDDMALFRADGFVA
jgi:hypothetical protein